MTMPSFDGSYTKWKQFEELFTQMVASQQIGGTQKIIYLKQNLTGEAAKLIQHISVTEDNFAVAWKILQDRYNNNRLIFGAILQNIMKMDSAKVGNAKSLKIVHDITLRHTSFKSHS